MQGFAPRGWRAALAAEQQGVTRLQARQRAAAASQNAGRISERATASATQPSRPALAETHLPWGASREPEAQCQAPAASATASGQSLQLQGPYVWLLAAAALAVAFLAGWLTGRWQLRRYRGRRKHTAMGSEPAAAVAGAVAKLVDEGGTGKVQQPEAALAADVAATTAAAAAADAARVSPPLRPESMPAQQLQAPPNEAAAGSPSPACVSNHEHSTAAAPLPAAGQSALAPQPEPPPAAVRRADSRVAVT